MFDDYSGRSALLEEQEILEPDGALSREVMPDLLHLSAEGYRRWAQALEPALRELGL